MVIIVLTQGLKKWNIEAPYGTEGLEFVRLLTDFLDGLSPAEAPLGKRQYLYGCANKKDCKTAVFFHTLKHEISKYNPFAENSFKKAKSRPKEGRL